MNFFERLYGILFQPKQTLRDILKNKPIWQSIIVLILTGVLAITSRKFDFMQLPIMPGEPTIGLQRMYSIIITFAVFITIFVSPIIVFVRVSIFHFLAELFGGKLYYKTEDETNTEQTGSESENLQDINEIINKQSDILGTAKGLYSALAFSSLPMIFIVPINFILRFTSGSTELILSSLFNLGFAIWILILEVIAIRENYKMSTGNSILVYFLPTIVMIVLFIIFLVYFGTIFVSFMTFFKDLPMY